MTRLVVQNRCLRIGDLVVDLSQVEYINTVGAVGSNESIIRFKSGQSATLIHMSVTDLAHLRDAFETYLLGGI